MNLNLIDNPELAALPSVAAQIAVWFWNDKQLTPLADGTFYNYSMMTWKINGGLKGMKERTENLEIAMEALVCGDILKGT